MARSLLQWPATRVPRRTCAGRIMLVIAGAQRPISRARDPVTGRAPLTLCDRSPGATLAHDMQHLLRFTRRKRELNLAADDLVAGQVLAQGVGVPARPPAFCRAIASGQLNRGADVGLVVDLLGYSSSTVRKQCTRTTSRHAGRVRSVRRLGIRGGRRARPNDALRRPPNTDAGYPSTTLPPGVSGYR